MENCNNNAGSYTCTCITGYSRVGTNCQDINECATSPCVLTNEECANSPGSYACVCKTGYTRSSLGQCVDIDECSTSNGGCSQNCHNTAGSYFCTCGTGYQLASGTSCNDINECSLNTDRCVQGCTNNIGSYTCSCNGGYYKSSTYGCTLVGFSVSASGSVISSTSVRFSWTTTFSPSSQSTTVNHYLYSRDLAFSILNVNIYQTTSVSLTATINGLLPYRNYRFFIRAVSSATSIDSNYVTIRTNEDIPSSGPSTLTPSVQSSSQIHLSWSAPSLEDQNGILLTYTILYATSSSDQLNGRGTSISVSASITSYTLTGLSAYTEYWLSVAASTSVGRGPYTNRSSAVRTYESIPTAAPVMAVASKTSTSITLTLQPPTNTALINGVIIYYSVSFTGINVDTTTNLRVAPSSGNYLSPVTSVLSPLQEGVSYNIEASMYTSVGGGPSSNILTVTTQESVPAGIPQNIQFTSVQTTSLTLSWDPPLLMDQNGVISGYRLSYRGVSVDTQVMVIDTVNSYVTLSNLEEGSEYTIDIWAQNSAGNGPSVVTTSSTIEIAPNGSPRDFVARSNSPTSISLTWQAPSAESQNGIITGYQIELVGRAYDTSAYLINVTGTIRSHTIYRLEKGHSYQVAIKSRNSAGLGPATNLIIISTRESEPGTPPEGFQALQGRTWISLMWNPPRVAEQNGNITEYEIEYSGTNIDQNNGSFYAQALTTNISNLEQYEFYRIRIRAFTAIGPGPFSSQLAIRTLQDAPSAPPRSVQSNAVSSKEISLSWLSPPINDQNGVLTGFQILITSDSNAFSQRVSVGATDSNHIFMNLHPYVNYIVQVQAETSPGLGPYSTAITVETHQAAPSGTPLRVETTRFMRSIALQWQAPVASEQNGVITGYLVMYRGLEVDTEMKNFTTNSIASLLENLHPGNDYQISLCAYTFVGVGPCLTFTNSTIPIPPSKSPQNVTVNASGSTSLLISWEPPETFYRNGIITGYTIITIGKGHDSSVYQHNVGPNLRSFIINNLEESHYYDISISAENKAGSGPFTKNYTVLTNGGAPSSAPQNLRGNSTQTSIFVSWNAPPAPDHNGEITQYELSYEGTTLDANSNYSIYETGLMAVLSNLHVNEIYQIRVRAFTSFGAGPYSTVILIKTLESRPTAAPERVNLISDSDTQITVNWNDPALADQNGVLTGFDLNLVSEDNSYQDDVSVATPRQTYSFTNLHPYTNYIVKVRATTQPGPGPYSPPLTVSTQQAAPTGPPRNIQAVISSNTLSFSWDAPDPSLQNGIIVGYQITYQGTAVDTSVTVITTTNNTATLTDLEEGAEYSIQVCAMTISIGPCIQWMNFTSETIPTGVPTNVQIQAITANTITLSWEAPILPLRNGILTGYEVIAVGQQHDTNEYQTRLNENMLSYTFENLEESHAYNIKLRAVNAIGFGPFTTIVTIITLEAATGAAPMNLTANSTETTITLHWNPPPIQYQNGILRYYEIEYYSTSDFLSIEQKVANVSASQNTITIENLQEYAEFQFKVRAYTSIGPGPYSSEITVTTQPSEPSSAPTNLQALSLTSTQIQVTWDPPSAIDQNGPITQYQIVLSPSSTTYATSQTIHTINALHPYTRYSVQVRAENSVGAGPYTSSVTVTTRQAMPSAPPTHLTLISVTHNSANVSWRSPMDDSLNGPLQSYTLNVTNTLTSTSFIETATTSHTLLDSLTPNTRYSLIVAAVNSQGTGPYTSELFFSTQQSSPTQPPHITQISDNSPHSISLQWNAILAHFQNGPILSYTANISTSEDDLLVSSQTVLHPTTTATFTDLHPYTEYTLAVSGNNAAGTSPSDYRAHTTEEDSPTGTPTSLSAVPSSTSITLSWQPPSSDLQNGIIIEYSIRFQSSNYVTNTTEYVITGLEEFTMFQWSVAARTSIGIGPYSDTQNVSTLANPPSQPPQNVTGMALSDQSIFVSWEAVPPAHRNGIIINYIVYFEGRKYDVSEGKIVQPENTTSIILRHLKPFENYKISVVAENSQGSSPRSPTLVVTTFEGTPSVAPTGFTAQYTSPTSISANWIAIPGREQNGYLINYEIIFYGNEFDVVQSKLTTPGNATSGMLLDLHPNVQYTVFVRGLTNVGNGPNSPSVDILLPESIPSGSPRIQQIDAVSTTDIFVAWNAVSQSETNGDIIAYEVTYSLSDTNNSNPASYQNSSLVALNVTLNGLAVGTMYEIRVRSYTAVGPGPYSDVFTGTTAPELIQCYSYYNQYFHNPCHNNGTCLSGGDIPYDCQCVPGYTGPVCYTNINDCEINHCGTNGRCVDQINGYMCVCDAGFTGEHCQDNINDCEQHNCQNGTCVDGLEEYTCSCFPNYNGTYCQYFNTCSSSPCVHGSCSWENNVYNCTCELGYEGNHCESNIDDCKDNDCENGECIDGVNEYTCDCSEEYRGTYCEIKVTANTCESQELVGFKWDETKQGTSVTVPCKDAKSDLIGIATRMCTKEGNWGKLDISNCTRPTFEELEIEFKNQTKQSPELSPIVAETLSNRMEEIICNNSEFNEGSNPTFYPYGISVIAQVLTNLVESIELQDKTTQAVTVPMITRAVLCVISRIINPRNLEIFHNTDSTAQAIIFNELVERVAKLNAQNFDTSKTTEPLTFDHENIQMFIAPLTNKQSASIPNYNLAASKDTGLYPDSVHIPESEVSALFSKANGNTPVIALVFNRYIGQVMGMHFIDSSFNIGTRVITVQSNMEDHLTFTDPINLKYWIFPPYNSTLRAVCSSWNGGNWSDEGMHIATRGDNTITCASSHATSFAILLSSQAVPLPLKEEDYLIDSIITYALALVSLLSMIASLLMLILLGKTLLKKDLFLIHFNLGIALTFALIFCVLGTQKLPPILCKIFAVAFQYFAFASLSWSLCNAVQIIYMLHAKVKLRRTIPIMLVSGWMLPLIVVAPVAGVKWSDYGVDNKYCWLSEDTLTFWLIAGPILGTNLVILILSLYTICRISTSRPKAEWYVDARSAVFGLLLMVVVTTVPWGMSLVNFFFPYQFYKWGFPISYALQGLFFFIFYVIGNRSVRTQLFKLKRKSGDLQDPPNNNGSQRGRTRDDFNINPVIQSDYVNPLFDTENMECKKSDFKDPYEVIFSENEYKDNLDLQKGHSSLTFTSKMHVSKESPYQSMEKMPPMAEDNPYMEIHENDRANPFTEPAGIDELEKDTSQKVGMSKMNPFTENGFAEAKISCTSEMSYDIHDEKGAKEKLLSEQSYADQGFSQENPCYQVVEGIINFGADRLSGDDSDIGTDA